ncbi:hypothetical protein OC834_006301 [Tilletia horrida]|nr:hypothetical protein OC834_006301 [Tilletia horrida]
MPLHHFLPPHPTNRGERTHTFGRPHVLAVAPAQADQAAYGVTPTETLRHQHLRKTFDILHLSLLRSDGPRAARALRVLVRSKEWRDVELWRYGLAVAGLLARDAALEAYASAQADEGDDGEQAESSQQALFKEVEEAVAQRRLAYLRGLYRVKPALRSEILADIVYELIELKRYDEAMREIEYVLDTHPFRTNPTLHLLAGILTVDSGLQAAGAIGPSSTGEELADLPPAVRRAAEHHFQRALSAARKAEVDAQMAVEARIEGQRRRHDAIQSRQRGRIEKELEEERQKYQIHEEKVLTNKLKFKRVPNRLRRNHNQTELAQQLRLNKAELAYSGPLRWAVTLAREGNLPESDVDDDEDAASQHSAVPDDDEEAEEEEEEAEEAAAAAAAAAVGASRPIRARSGSPSAPAPAQADSDVEMAGANEPAEESSGPRRSTRISRPRRTLAAPELYLNHGDEHDSDDGRDVYVPHQAQGDGEDGEDEAGAGPTTAAAAEGGAEAEAAAAAPAPQKPPSLLATAARLLEGWTKSEDAQRPATWETDAANLYLSLLQSEE